MSILHDTFIGMAASRRFLSRHGGSVTGLYVLSSDVIHLLQYGLLGVCSWWPVSIRNRFRDDWPFSSSPTPADVRAFVDTIDTVGSDSNASFKRLARIPKRVHNKLRRGAHSPIHIFRWLAAARHLRKLENLPTVVDDIQEALFPESGRKAVRDLFAAGYRFPGRHRLEEGRRRLDIVCMFLQRRETASGSMSRTYGNRCIYLSCDASPVLGK